MTKTTQHAKKLEAKEKLKSKQIPLWIWLILGIVIIGGIFMLTSQQASSSNPNMKAEVSVDEAAKLRDEGVFILDVREQSEWDQFHIPEATLIPLGELASRVSELPNDKTIVVVCRTGRRSAEGRDILKKAGFENVTSMAGGVTEWQSKGLPIATGK